MKRILFLMSLLSTVLIVNAQNINCTDIKKTSNEFTGVTKYNSPSGIPGLMFLKVFTNNEAVNSVVLICTSIIGDSTTRGAYIKLDDGTIIKDENAKPKIYYNRIIGWEYYSTITLTKEQMQNLSEHRIVKFAIADLMNDVNKWHSELYWEHVNCFKLITQP